MYTNPLEYLPVWAYFLLITGFIGMSLLGGWALGTRYQNRSGSSESGTSGITVGALLSLLGFMLAFTFGMANTRYEDRRQAVLEEANIIGTAYLRADLLPDLQASEAEKLLRRYIQVRLGDNDELDVGVPHNYLSPEDIQELIAMSESIQRELWKITIEAAELTPSPIVGLFIQAINDLIDVHTKRVALGTKSTIPFQIWLCLYLLAGVGLGAAGFQSATGGRQSVYPIAAMVLAFASIMTVITDIDNPYRGIMKTDQSPMLELSKAVAPRV